MLDHFNSSVESISNIRDTVVYVRASLTSQTHLYRYQRDLAAYGDGKQTAMQPLSHPGIHIFLSIIPS